MPARLLLVHPDHPGRRPPARSGRSPGSRAPRNWCTVITPSTVPPSTTATIGECCDLHRRRVRPHDGTVTVPLRQIRTQAARQSCADGFRVVRSSSAAHCAGGLRWRLGGSDPGRWRRRESATGGRAVSRPGHPSSSPPPACAVSDGESCRWSANRRDARSRNRSVRPPSRLTSTAGFGEDGVRRASGRPCPEELA
jgi:hypothetical protein